MRFEKVRLEEACMQTEEIVGSANEANIKAALEGLSLPKRSTKGSAGYDFRSPFDVAARKGDIVRIPLFVKVEDMPKGVVLLIFNRSGLSLKKGLRLDNAVGVIDSDYKFGIVFQATATKDIAIVQGDKVCQGIFLNYLTVDGDDSDGERNGGFGSTGR